ncbi:MAG TPA: M28 family peptidase [Terriglobales bacterium]|nr:M28 family peptidase [Terriglobales bacterium]
MRKLFVVALIVAGIALTAIAGSKTTSRHRQAQPALNPNAVPPEALAAMKSIDAERIRAHVKFLSDDLLEGRGTGQRGGDIAAAYIATQFALYGLKPAGDGGTYLQHVPLVGITTQPESTFAIVPEHGEPMTLRLREDYVATDQSQQAASDIDTPIVFVGYGIEAPEFQWDDYKGVDLRGKALLMLVNEPPSDDPNFFAGKALTYYGRWTYKYEEALRRGAVAAILIHKTDMASYGWEVVRNSWSGENSYLRTEGPKLKAVGWVSFGTAHRIAEAAGQDLDQWLARANSRDFHPVPLPLTLKAHLVSKVRSFTSANVIAMLPGSDPKLRSEAVLYTAHYDHLGIHPEAPGDNIYNGAMDNGTGCGILLELARAYASVTKQPKRSILFASVTAEEQGLRGSEYLGQHPPVPAAKIALDLNYDNLLALGTAEEVSVPGAERTTFYHVVEATARQFELTIRPDPHPENGHYYRSDHFSLARVGVPAFSIKEGEKFKGHAAEWGARQNLEYEQKRYHQPSDEYSPEMDFSGDAVMARFGFVLGWKAASLPEMPAWRPGDEFEAARRKSEAAAGAR